MSYRSLLGTFCLSLFLISVFPVLAKAASNVALVIGNGAYEESISTLDNPERDARDVASAFEAQGYDVVLALDLGQRALQSKLIEFRKKADAADIAIVYYAGHGIEIGGQNYIVPVDARLFDERSAPLELIDIDTVLTQISGASKLRMLVLDACRNNPFVSRMKRLDAGRSVGRGLGRVSDTGSETLVAFAAAAGDVTPDGEPGQNSPFTAAFLKALNGPAMDVRLLLGRVRDELQSTLFGAQPAIYGSLGGQQIVINPGSAPAPGPDAPAGAAGAALLADFLKADQANTLEALNIFLDTYEAAQNQPLYQLALQKRDNLQAVAEAEARERAAEEAERARKVAETRRQLEDLRKKAEDAERVLAEMQAAEARLAALQAAPREAGVASEETPGVGNMEGPPETELAATTAATPAPLPLPVLPVLTEEQLAQQKDAAIRDFQRVLKDRNCYTGAIDGIVGAGTLRGSTTLAEKVTFEVPAGDKATTEAYLAAIAAIQAAPGATCPKVAAPAKTTRRTTTRRTTTRKTTQPTTSRYQDYTNERGEFCDWYNRGNTCE